MSETEGETDERPRREVAHRVFAAEFDDASLSYSESDEERAPNYVVTPTGARANRLFVAGVLTELEALDSDQLRARIADPTGVFVVYAGQYQPDALAALERLEPPAFVAVTGKARIFEPEDSDRVFTSIRPETISEIDAATRDRWIVETTAQTLDRIGAFAAALAEGEPSADGEVPTGGVRSEQAGDEGDTTHSGISLAREHYGTTPAYLAAVREAALDAARLVAGDGEDVRPLDIAPDEKGDRDEVDLDSLAAGSAGESAVAALTGAETDAETTVPEPTEPETPEGASAGTDTAGVGAVDDSNDSDDIDDTDGPIGAGDPTPMTDVDGKTGDAGTNDGAASGSEAMDTDGSEADEFATSSTEESGSEPGPVDDVSGIDSTGDAGEFGEGNGFEGEDGEDSEEFEGEFDLSDEERAEIEAEYGTDFSTGSEVDDPGEADIEPTAPPIEDNDERSEDDLPADDRAMGDVDPGGDAIDEFAAETESGPEFNSGGKPKAKAESRTGAGTEAETETTDSTDPTEPVEPGTDSDDALDDDFDTGSVDESEPTSGSEADDAGAADDGTPSDEEPTSNGIETDVVEADADRDPADVDAGGDDAEDVDATEAVMDAMRALDDGDGAERGRVIERVEEEHGIDEDEAEAAIQDALMGGQCYEPDEGKLKAI